MSNRYECLNCRMEVLVSTENCPKCDSHIASQSTGEILEVDIAHNRETIAQALAKLDESIQQAQKMRAQALRVIVGRGLIREEVMGQLQWLKRDASVHDFDYDRGNLGAIIVTLRE
ncbi:MAG: Smr/MutS family protein [Pseudohongiellaceae bacterium]|nr:Smr/MutS family protein [Pseudohongiellaceae bacterium]